MLGPIGPAFLESDLIKVEYESFDPFEATETGSGYQAKSGQPPKHDPRNSGR
jgi:hypothetical protein